MYQIDLLYWIPLSLLSIAIIAILLKRDVNLWIGLMGIGLGALVTWYTSPYTQYAIIPVYNYWAYGTDFTLKTAVGLFHVISLVFMSAIALWNLYKTKGYTLWLMVMPKTIGMNARPSLRNSIRNDESGVAGIVILAVAGIITAGAVVSYGIYRFFQSPEITYNITNPPESAYPSIFKVGGTGLNINLVIIAIAGIVLIYSFYRASKGD